MAEKLTCETSTVKLVANQALSLRGICLAMQEDFRHRGREDRPYG